MAKTETVVSPHELVCAVQLQPRLGDLRTRVHVAQVEVKIARVQVVVVVDADVGVFAQRRIALLLRLVVSADHAHGGVGIGGQCVVLTVRDTGRRDCQGGDGRQHNEKCTSSNHGFTLPLISGT